MYLITVLLKQSQQLFQFHYNNFKDANTVLTNYGTVYPKSFDSVENHFLNVEDDYGGKAAISMPEIAGIILTDVDREMEAQKAVDWAKIGKDIKLQKRVQENPSARVLQAPSGLRV